MRKLIKIGTRGSLLATTQSTWVKNQIEAQHPGVSVELVIIVTKGDKILDVPLAMVGGKGLFVKEIEEALLRKDVDLAVHSMKDVPSELPEELHLGITPLRENPHDAFISARYKTLADLPQGATVGTSSLRRRAQLAALRPDLKIVDLRGNLDTAVPGNHSGSSRSEPSWHELKGNRILYSQRNAACSRTGGPWH
jgi:hydroxymethylbilane synthase